MPACRDRTPGEPWVLRTYPGRPHLLMFTRGRESSQPCVVLASCREESGHECGYLGGAFQHEQMAALADHVQLRVRDAPCEDVAVDQRNDRVIITGEHEGRLP